MASEPLFANHADDLITAACEGALDKVRQLVAAGGDVNAADEFGRTAVIAAAERGQDTIIEFLLGHGADINTTDTDGDTALDIARYQENASTVELLLSHSAKGADGPSAKEQMMDAYYDDMRSVQSRHFDDRMYVLEVTRAKATSHPVTVDGTKLECVTVTHGGAASEEKGTWAVIARRNVPGYPPSWCKVFDRREDAIAHLKKVAPHTPRLSLDGESPSPAPTWEEHQEWLAAIGVGKLPY